MTTQVCDRCRRDAPSEESSEFVGWEVLEPEANTIICPDCLTGAEQASIDEADFTLQDKVRENRLRRIAERQGYKLTKSRRRDPLAYDYGAYWITDPQKGGSIVAGEPRTGMDLNDVETWLTEHRPFADYVEDRMRAEGDDPSVDIARLYGLTGRDHSNDLNGLLEALERAISTADYDTVGEIGDLISDLANQAEAEAEIARGPR